MRTDLRTLLHDIKAAARIGHAESVWTALEGLLDYPQIAGNHPLDETFLKQVVLPVGQALAAPALSQAILQPLITHSSAALRSIAAVTLLERYLKGLNGSNLKTLTQLAQDPRPDVRLAVLLACRIAVSHAPEKQTAIFESWMADTSPYLQALALQLLPSLPVSVILQQLNRLESYQPSQEPSVKRALADAISTLGQDEFCPQVLTILSNWADDAERYDWIITESLSRSWAAAVPQESLAILTRLAAKQSGRKRILSTLEALQRHGAGNEVQATLQEWLISGNQQLQTAARKVQDKHSTTKDQK
jgi:hypothetical protein